MEIESTVQQDRYLEFPSLRPRLIAVNGALGRLVPKFLLAFYAFVSIAAPLTALTLYRANLESQGIFLESGCHGPDAFFGSLTGMMFCLFLRFGFAPFFPLDRKHTEKSGNASVVESRQTNPL